MPDTEAVHGKVLEYLRHAVREANERELDAVHWRAVRNKIDKMSDKTDLRGVGLVADSVVVRDDMFEALVHVMTWLNFRADEHAEAGRLKRDVRMAATFPGVISGEVNGSIKITGVDVRT